LPALEIDSEHTTANTVIIKSDILVSGSALDISENSSDTTARNVVSIRQDHASAVSSTALHLQSDGGRGLFIDSNLAAGKPSLEIDSEHTSANTIHIASDALTTGSALTITSAGTHSSNLVSFISDGAATGPTLHLRSDASTSTVKVFQVANSTADIFSVTQAGDASIGNDLTIAGDFTVTGNLAVSGSTTEINTTSTLVQDKTLVLGSVGAVRNATWTSHATTPTFTTAAGTVHGLSVSSVIFVSSSEGGGVSSETLYTVASAANTSTFTLSGTIDSQSGTRAMTFVGPQTDALANNAGIYAPGSTAIHTWKWDDTLNYWESNASLHINDTGQLVLPKGTTAQKPAAAATATVPAATTGAMRYNSSTSKIEAVITSTSYENMSTETFATAIAIALG